MLSTRPSLPGLPPFVAAGTLANAPRRRLLPGALLSPWLLSAWLLAVSAQAHDIPTTGAAAAQAQPFELHGSGHILIPAVIEGTEVRMVLDTGAGATIVDSRAAERLGLRLQDSGLRASGAGGGDLAYRKAAGGSLSVAGLADAGVAIGVMDLSHVVDAFARQGLQVSGVIGADFLVRHGAVIDYPNRRITLATAADEVDAPRDGQAGRLE